MVQKTLRLHCETTFRCAVVTRSPANIEWKMIMRRPSAFRTPYLRPAFPLAIWRIFQPNNGKNFGLEILFSEITAPTKARSMIFKYNIPRTNLFYRCFFDSPFEHLRFCSVNLQKSTNSVLDSFILFVKTPKKLPYRNFGSCFGPLDRTRLFSSTETNTKC